jgi:hypothetical protein
MKNPLLLLPLIAALSGLTYAEDVAKPMNGMGGMDKMDMKPGADTKPGADMKKMHDMHDIHDKCMGDNKAADNGKGMDDMKAMHDKCMQAKDAKKPADKAVKKPKHRKSTQTKPESAPEHDHNHGAAAGQ